MEIKAPTAHIIAKAIIGFMLSCILSAKIAAYIAPRAAAPITPPTAPSIDFLGLSTGAILCLPNATPARYAHVSLPHEQRKINQTV